MQPWDAFTNLDDLALHAAIDAAHAFIGAETDTPAAGAPAGWDDDQLLAESIALAGGEQMIIT